MESEQFKQTLAHNLAACRRNAGLTQSELGQKLNYSDKSISKWERGEGAPDAFVLTRLADLYGISMDALTGRASAQEADPNANGADAARARQKLALKDKLLALTMAISVIWLIAVIAFSVPVIAFPGRVRAWLAFVYAAPASLICAGVFLLKWKRYVSAFITFSLVMWTLCTCAHITFPVSGMYLIYIIGAVTQLFATLLTGMTARVRLRRTSDKRHD